MAKRSQAAVSRLQCKLSGFSSSSFVNKLYLNVLLDLSSAGRTLLKKSLAGGLCLGATGARGGKYVINCQRDMDWNGAISKILKGVDILLVDPQCYSHMVSPLYIFLEQFKAQDLEDMVEKVNFLIKYCEEYPLRQAIAEKLSIKIHEPEPKPPVITREKVNEIVDELFSSGKIESFAKDELELIVAEIRRRKNDYISEGNYELAQAADHYTKVMTNYGYFGEVEQMQCAKINEIKTKLSEAELHLQSSKERWEALYSNMKKEACDDLRKVNESFEQQVKELLNDRDNDPPQSFIKFSSYLLELRRKQKALIDTKCYEDAANIKDLADSVEKEEIEAMKTKWREKIDQRISTIRSEQKKILEARRNYWRNEKNSIIHDANEDVEKVETCIARLRKSLANAINTHKTAGSLKEETKMFHNGLPPLARVQSRLSATAFRQRAMLNTRACSRSTKR